MVSILNNKLLWVAVLPPIALLVYIYIMDKKEKESLGILLNLYVRGVVSCVPAVALEYAGEYVLSAYLPSNDYRYNIYKAFLVVALSEELCKFVAAKKYTWYSYEFNHRFDGVVYGVFASMGFATLENILYVFNNGFNTGLMRAVLAIPGHMIFGVYMGLFYGKSKEYTMRGCGIRSAFCTLMSVAFPMCLHGIYDYCLFERTQTTMIAFVLYIIIAYVTTFFVIQHYSKNDYHLMRRRRR